MKVLTELLNSKKALASVGAIVAIVAAKLGLDPETATFLADKIVIVAVGYVVAQGAADWGKSSSLIKSALADAPTLAKQVLEGLPESVAEAETKIDE